MRTARALSVTIERFDRWRLGAFSLGAPALACAWTWAFLRLGALETLAALACTAVTLEVLRYESRRASLCLQFDGAEWQWWVPESGDAAPRSGQVQVCIDLGTWIMLRFVESEPSAFPVLPPRRRSMFIPIQRRGHEQCWHALRCAVYSPATSAEPARNATGSNQSAS
jgi:hypothetical protein